MGILETIVPESGEDLRPTETAYGIYRVLPSVHSRATTLKELGNARTAFLDFSYVHGGSVEELASSLPNQLAKFKQVETIMKSVQMDTLYMIDVLYDRNFDELMDRERDENVLKAIAGATAVVAGSMMQFSRRYVLKGAGLAVAALGAYLATPVTGAMLNIFGYDSDWQRKIDQKHWRHLLFFRNLVFVHKAEYIAQKIFETTGKKPEIAMPVGAAHGLVKKVLTDFTSQQRQQLIAGVLAELESNSSIPASSLTRLKKNMYEIPFLDKKNSRVGIMDMQKGTIETAPTEIFGSVFR